MSRSLAFRSLLSTCLVGVVLLVGAGSASASFGFLNGLNMYGGGSSGDLLQFGGPTAIALADDGSLFVVDNGNSRVVKLNSSGEFVLEFGNPGNGDGEFNAPTDIVIGPNDEVYVSDGSNHRIQRFDQSGGFLGKWGSMGGLDGQFNFPVGLAVDSSGDVFVSDTNNNRIQHFDADGTYIDQWGSAGTGDGQFNKPFGISVAENDAIYVVDRFNNRVQYFAPTTHAFAGKFGCSCSAPEYVGLSAAYDVFVDQATSPDEVYVSNNFNDNRIARASLTGTPLSRWGNNLSPGPPTGSGPGEFNAPEGILVTPDNKVYVADRGNQRISIFTGGSTALPTPLAQWGGNGLGPGQFNQVQGVAAADDGSVYAVDHENARIQHLSVTGQVINAWGTSGTGDGQFVEPRGIALGPNGDVYVADYGNHRVQRFSSTGTFVGKWSATEPGVGVLDYPMDVDTDDAGFVYVTDSSNRQIVKYEADGTYVSKFGQVGTDDTDADFQFPSGIAVDPSGSPIYVVDEGSHRVKKFDGSGNYLAHSYAHTYSPSVEDGRFSYPSMIDIDPLTGDVVVADAWNHRLQRFSSSLVFVTKYGQNGRDFGQFRYPRGISFDPNGNMWIGDGENDRVQRFGDAPVVTITSPTSGSALTGTSVQLNYTVSDTAADCDIANGATIGPLASGSQTITVICSNRRGSGSASVNVNVPAPILPVVTLPAPGAVSLKLPKKLKLSKSRKLKFSVTCPDGCTVTPKLLFGKKPTRIKAIRTAASTRPQTVTITLSKTIGTKAKAWMANNRSLYLSVTVQSYKATQGKTGKAKVAK